MIVVCINKKGINTEFKPYWKYRYYWFFHLNDFDDHRYDDDLLLENKEPNRYPVSWWIVPGTIKD